MAVKPTAPRPEGPKDQVKDVDDAIADRFHGGKDAPSGARPGAQGKLPVKPTPRKAGHVIDTPGEQHEEHVAEPDAKHVKGTGPSVGDEKKEIRDKKKAPPAEKGKQKRGEDEKGQGEPDSEKEPEAPSTTAAHLAFDANYHRSLSARRMGFEQTPSISDVVAGKESATTGESLGVLLPSARARSHPDLPDTELRPPDFLTPLEAMSDIYMRTRGRMTRRTKELLEGPDLEDLLAMLRALHEDEKLVKSGEARILSKVRAKFEKDPGPLVLGLTDPKLTEPWRLFLDGWEIWVPDGDEGVDLFWEGEAEDDAGAPLELLQSLQLRGGELTLYTRAGDAQDEITFDGEAFYRLKNERPVPRKD